METEKMTVDDALQFAIYGWCSGDDHETSHLQEVSAILRKKFRTPSKLGKKLKEMINFEHREYVEVLYNVFNLWAPDED